MWITRSISYSWLYNCSLDFREEGELEMPISDDEDIDEYSDDGKDNALAKK